LKNRLYPLLAIGATLSLVGTARAAGGTLTPNYTGEPVDGSNVVSAAGGPGLTRSYPPGVSWQWNSQYGFSALADSTNSMWDMAVGKAAEDWYFDKNYGGNASLDWPTVTSFGPDLMPTDDQWSLPNGNRPTLPYPDLEVDVSSSSYSLSAICGNLPGASIVKRGVAGKDYCQISYAGQVFPVVFKVTNGATAVSGGLTYAPASGER
jgi:hypothetical protein